MKPKRRVRLLHVESLETRCLLSGSSVAAPLVTQSDQEDSNSTALVRTTDGEDSPQITYAPRDQTGATSSDDNGTDGSGDGVSERDDSSEHEDGKENTPAPATTSSGPSTSSGATGSSSSVSSANTGSTSTGQSSNNEDSATTPPSNATEDQTATSSSSSTSEDSASEGASTTTVQSSTPSSGGGSSLSAPVAHSSSGTSSTPIVSHTQTVAPAPQSAAPADNSDQPVNTQDPAEEPAEPLAVVGASQATKTAVAATPGRSDGLTAATPAAQPIEAHSFSGVPGTMDFQASAAVPASERGPIVRSNPVLDQERTVRADLAQHTPAQWLESPATVFSADALNHAAFESAWASPALLSSVLPVDLTGLEASIKDLFRQIDELGEAFSAARVDVLFSTGVVALAAAVAVEITRRHLQPVAYPALTHGRGKLPHSDYP